MEQGKGPPGAVVREYLAILCQELGLRTTARRLRIPYRRPALLRQVHGTQREPQSEIASTPLNATPAIIETAQELQLQFSSHSLQSRMRLDDPYALIAGYTRQMMSFLLFDPDPEHVLLIGLGGGSLAKFCYRHLPNARITAVEIDERVIAMRDAFFIPPDDDRFRVVHDDGARYLARCEQPVNAILIDAFDRDGVTPALASAAFFNRAAALLSPKGALIMNLLGDRQHFAGHLQRADEGFGSRAMLVPVTGNDNRLLYAFAPGSAPPSARHLHLRARHLQSKMPLNFRHYLKLIRQGEPLSAEAPFRLHKKYM